MPDVDASPSRAALLAQFPFALDTFQLEAIDALDAGQSVLVAAPTGSGKTVVAEYAIGAALAAGKRAFYTAPVKALSNQKYRDLSVVHRDVGLLTGDNAINGDGPVVVMTTEVLRNMIYADSPALRELAVVVLDEVHFLQDAYRGPVWEEVIIHLPAHVRLVCLSATVSNAVEVADWIATVRGATRAVVEERRPVRLESSYLVGDRSSDRLQLLPVEVDGHPNPVAIRLEADSTPMLRQRRGRPAGKPRRRLYTPSRLDVVDRLEREGMLPAIHFIFSRKACDEAATQCLASGVRLTSEVERRRIREIIDQRLGSMADDDLDVLGFPAFSAQLEAGVGAHHAGMVPPFKETVEACFVEGLIKVVFATETLAVGINMPARAVVIEKLTKFTGDHHEMLTPGEYTQLTGRAGRRGIDDAGDAIVLWSPFVSFQQVAALAGSRSFRLTSAFRPTYNMAANLVRSYTNQEAHHLLNLSFAQYQADREVVTLSARLERRQAHLAELRAGAESPYGDIHEYRASIDGPSNARSDAAIEVALARLRPGDVIHVDKGRSVGRAAVLTNAFRKGGVKLGVITAGRASLNLSGPDFVEPPSVLGRIDLPDPFAPHRPEFQRAVADLLDEADLGTAPRRERPRTAGEPHPVEGDPDLARRLALAAQGDRVAAEVDHLRTRVRRHTQSVSQGFDRVLGVLGEWGYVDGWSLTDAGEVLSRLFHECDLLVAECLRRGLLDGLQPSHLAALVSVFVYEHRSSEAPPPPWFPSGEVRERWQQIATLSKAIGDAESLARLPVHRPPDPTFVAVAFAWAAGEGFAEVVEAEDLSGGDFVRTTKSLIDLLRQLAMVAPAGATRRPRRPRPPNGCCAAWSRRRAASSRLHDRRDVSRSARSRHSARSRSAATGLTASSVLSEGTFLAEPDTRVTVRKGEAWGTTGPAPAGLAVVRSDRDLFEHVNRARHSGRDPAPVGLGGGDLWLAVGGVEDPHRFEHDVAILPVDLLRVDVDGEPFWAAAHVIGRRWRGLQGPIVAAMNGQYLGRRDVAPKAHPGDGLVDIVQVDPAMAVRERWQASRRLPLGTHVPHAKIATRRVPAAVIELPERLSVAVDGQRVGRARRLEITVEPDALTVYV